MSVYAEQAVGLKIGFDGIHSFINYIFPEREESLPLQALAGHHAGNGLHLEVWSQKHCHVRLRLFGSILIPVGNNRSQRSDKYCYFTTVVSNMYGFE